MHDEKDQTRIGQAAGLWKFFRYYLLKVKDYMMTFTGQRKTARKRARGRRAGKDAGTRTFNPRQNIPDT